jgi:hypothetical protein
MSPVQVSNKVTAVFTCIKCQRKETADVSEYMKQEKNLWFNVECRCGHGYTAIIERRKQYRKETELDGTFAQFVDGKEVCSGNMTVYDLSLNGMKLKADVEHCLSVGDLLHIEFQLDDIRKSTIRKKVIIRNINFPFLHTEFHSAEAFDQALGFYLFQ